MFYTVLFTNSITYYSWVIGALDEWYDEQARSHFPCASIYIVLGMDLKVSYLFSCSYFHLAFRGEGWNCNSTCSCCTFCFELDLAMINSIYRSTTPTAKGRRMRSIWNFCRAYVVGSRQSLRSKTTRKIR